MSEDIDQEPETENDGTEPEQATEETGSILIKPSIGRVALYNDGFSDQRCAATIAYVHDDCHINVGYIDQKGVAQRRENVYLIQEEGRYCQVNQCEWMEHQKDQAKIWCS